MKNNEAFNEYFEKTVKLMKKHEALEKFSKVYMTDHSVNSDDPAVKAIQRELIDTSDDIWYRLGKIGEMGVFSDFLDYYVDWA